MEMKRTCFLGSVVADNFLDDKINIIILFLKCSKNPTEVQRRQTIIIILN